MHGRNGCPPTGRGRYPHWFNAASEVEEVKLIPENRRHLLAVNITVTQGYVVIRNCHEDLWCVEWHLQQRVAGDGSRKKVTHHSTVEMTTSELRVAFCNDTLSPALYSELLEWYGGDEMVSHVFIRKDNFLNVSGPGSGMRMDPNVSLVITEEITMAIERLIEAYAACT